MSVEGKYIISPTAGDTKQEMTYDNRAYDQKGDEARTANEPVSEERLELGGDGTPEDDVTHYNAYQRGLLSVQKNSSTWCKRHRTVLLTMLGIVLALLYFVYFGWAMKYRFGDEGSWRLLWFTVFGVVLFVIVRLAKVYRGQLESCWDGTQNARASKGSRFFLGFIKWFLRVGVFVAVVVYVIIDVAIDHPGNLIAVAGLALYILIFYVTSINPAKSAVAGLALYILIFYVTSINPARINWHTVFWGIALQYVFALMILRTQWGYDIFKWLGDRVTEFLEYTMAGVLFVFGDKYYEHFFAMKVLSIVVFFFTVINILYYLGVMQAIIKVLGRFLAFCMGTSPGESINAAANIFVSMTESPLMIRPLLKDMTRSELHAVMTGGFATIAGSVLGAYISFGVPANHLLSASVMSAPAALAISKLSYPETETSKSSSADFDKMEKAPEHNVIEAASNGATASVKMVGAVAVNVLAFLSLLAFLNACLTFFGDRVGIDGLTFELICSYVLYPVPYFMGVATGDCRRVAELIGVKTFTNEFIAYGNLQTFIQNREAFTNYTQFYGTGNWYRDDDNDIVLNITGQLLKGGVMEEKSEIIATYALCGFANFGSIGIILGGLGVLAPTRKTDLSKMVVRAMICGNVACFLTACVAGLLYKPF